VGVITRKSSPFNADYASLIPLAKENNIPYFIAEGNNQLEMFNWLNKLSPDVIYCFGWSYLLKEPILKLPKLGIVGYHPAALPQNRGRHPIIWALALDLRETASTFFFMDEGADSGDILDQRFVPIFESDDASTLYNKLTEKACKQISEFTPKLITGNFIRVPQDHSKANYWRKRNQADGVIDWRMSARNIHNLVRALTRPYMGCQFIYDGKEIPVWKTELVDEISEYANVEPGKILKVEGHEITIRCGEGALKLIEHDCRMSLKKGDYL
jgi:methionyl-tRNA formyltransferase